MTGEAARIESAASRVRLIERLSPWALMAPALLIALFLFGLPTLYMLRMSFNEYEYPLHYVPGFTFEHYARLYNDPHFFGAILRTIRLSLMAAASTLVIGYSFALLAWFQPARWRLMFLALAASPLLISEISIIFGWWMFFPNNGLLSYALVSSGLVADKVSLMYTEFAAFVGLVYLTLPFCFFILLSVFDGIDRRLIDASSDLGAKPFSTFLEVLLPLTMPGIAVAFSQSFIWAMGAYATPSALGPDTLWTMGYLVQEQMLARRNWPMATALAMVLVVAIATVMVFTRSVMTKRRSFHA